MWISTRNSECLPAPHTTSKWKPLRYCDVIDTWSASSCDAKLFDYSDAESMNYIIVRLTFPAGKLPDTLVLWCVPEQITSATNAYGLFPITLYDGQASKMNETHMLDSIGNRLWKKLYTIWPFDYQNNCHQKPRNIVYEKKYIRESVINRVFHRSVSSVIQPAFIKTINIQDM